MVQLSSIQALDNGMHTMGIRKKSVRRRNTLATLATPRLVPELHIENFHEPKSITLPTDLDQFKFKLAERDGKHFFEKVRYNTPNVAESDRKTVIGYFEGRCLESITNTALRSKLKGHSMLPMFEQLVSGLRQIFCE